MKRFGDRIPCIVCEQLFPRNEYYRSNLERGVRRCRPCCVAATREWRRKNQEKVRASMLKGREKRKQRPLESFPEKIKCKTCEEFLPRDHYWLSALHTGDYRCKLCRREHHREYQRRRFNISAEKWRYKEKPPRPVYPDWTHI